MHPHVRTLHTYMEALGRSDYAAIKGLFTADGQASSPFLGEMQAAAFFDRLAAASAGNVITPIDVFLSNAREDSAVAYFRYDWTVTDGTLITFKAMDLFMFDRGSGLITYLDIIYDTYPIRSTSGNKYEA